MNKKTFLNKIKETVKSFDDKAEVVLFGSRARGNSSETSDWDLLILLDRQVNESLKDRIRDKLLETEIESEQVVSSIIYSKDRWNDLSITPLFRNVEKDGVLI